MGDLNGYLRRFLPRFKHLSTRIQGGNVQIYLHEAGPGPVPATRLSDGTISREAARKGNKGLDAPSPFAAS